MNAEDVENFFPKSNKVKSEEKVKSKPNSKRKRDTEPNDKEDEKEQIRQQCKYYCASIEEWNSVRKFKLDKQKDFIEEKQFLEAKNLSQTVFDTGHNAMALVLDLISKGEGYIEQEIKQDLTLRHTIEEEGQKLLYLVTNKYKILFLICIDLFTGHRKRLRDKPPKPTIVIEEERGTPGDCCGQEEAQHRSDPILGDYQQ